MPARDQSRISLDEAVNITRTGDLWMFRGRSGADRAIQMTTNSPVNHVGMAVVLEDLPPLMWHAELGRSLPDMWSGSHQRGVQLHDLRDAVLVWARRYGQRAWLRQLDHAVSRDMEDAVLRTIARLDGTPFPSTAQLAGRWVRGRLPTSTGHRWLPTNTARRWLPTSTARRWLPSPGRDRPPARRPAGERTDETGLETAYCAEVVAVTYEAMDLLPAGRRPNWYDPGRFWSGDDLELSGGARLGGEIAVEIPPR